MQYNNDMIPFIRYCVLSFLSIKGVLLWIYYLLRNTAISTIITREHHTTAKHTCIRMDINTVFVFLFGSDLKKITIIEARFHPVFTQLTEAAVTSGSSTMGVKKSRVPTMAMSSVTWQKKNKRFTMGVPMSIGMPPKQNYSQSRFPSKVGFGNFCWAIPGLWKQGLVDTCILIGLAKASQDLLTYDWSRRLEALARAAQELYTV